MMFIVTPTAETFTVTDDVILEQVETTYDTASHAVQVTLRQRYHNAPDTQTGSLHSPGTTPKARVSYQAAWYDGVGRSVATADYGTNGGTTLSRPDAVPASSDSVLVGQIVYDPTGPVQYTIDPAGMVTSFEYDQAGRRITVIENNVGSSSSSSSSSSTAECVPSDNANRTTLFTYTADGQQATLTAVNGATTDQTTTWTYGTTLSTADVASSLLLRSVAYPDSASSSDRLSYSYNRQGERTTLTDQRGCVHTYHYDGLGRPIHDCVTTLGSGVDGGVAQTLLQRLGSQEKLGAGILQLCLS